MRTFHQFVEAVDSDKVYQHLKIILKQPYTWKTTIQDIEYALATNDEDDVLKQYYQGWSEEELQAFLQQLKAHAGY